MVFAELIFFGIIAFGFLVVMSMVCVHCLLRREKPAFFWAAAVICFSQTLLLFHCVKYSLVKMLEIEGVFVFEDIIAILSICLCHGVNFFIAWHWEEKGFDI